MWTTDLEDLYRPLFGRAASLETMARLGNRPFRCEETSNNYGALTAQLQARVLHPSKHAEVGSRCSIIIYKLPPEQLQTVAWGSTFRRTVLPETAAIGDGPDRQHYLPNALVADGDNAPYLARSPISTVTKDASLQPIVDLESCMKMPVAHPENRAGHVWD
jgi:hypothetical protein